MLNVLTNTLQTVTDFTENRLVSFQNKIVQGRTRYGNPSLYVAVSSLQMLFWKKLLNATLKLTTYGM